MIPKLEAIKKLFLAEWDPIGVAGIPDASDEYDGYAMHVFTMLHQGADPNAIAEYLHWAETDHMGLSHASGRSRRIAEEVVAIHRT
jgi:hypothetical protein